MFHLKNVLKMVSIVFDRFVYLLENVPKFHRDQESKYIQNLLKFLVEELLILPLKSFEYFFDLFLIINVKSNPIFYDYLYALFCYSFPI